mgnify:CR=1 FL=1
MANYDSSHTGAVIDAAVTKATPTTLGTSEVSKCVTVDASGDLIVPDSDKFKFGAGSDMQLYHDGSNSFIQQSGTGALKIATEDSAKAISIGHTTSETTVNDNLTVTGNLSVTGTGQDLRQVGTGSFNTSGVTTSMPSIFDGTYNLYIIYAWDFRPASDGIDVLFRFQTGSGSEVSDTQYLHEMQCTRGSATYRQFTSGTTKVNQSTVLDGLGNAATETGWCRMTFPRMSSTSYWKQMFFEAGYIDDSGNTSYSNGAVSLRNNEGTAITGAQLTSNSGNWASGTWVCYGLAGG